MAQFADGTLCFSKSVAGAKADLARVVREWRDKRGQTAVKTFDPVYGTMYALKRHRLFIAHARIVLETS